MSNYVKFFFLIFLFISCTTTPQVVKSEDDYSASFFLINSFSNSPKYELLSFKDSYLYVEYGSVLSSKKNLKESNSPIDRNFLVQKRQKLKLNKQDKNQLTGLINKIINDTAFLELPDPGSLDPINGKGVFEVRLKHNNKQKHFITSYKAISDKNLKELKEINKLMNEVSKKASLPAEIKVFRRTTNR